MSASLARRIAAALILLAGTVHATPAPAPGPEPEPQVPVEGDDEVVESVAPEGAREEPFVTEAVEVTAKGTAADWPTALATDVVAYEDALAPPSDFQDFITRLPGVAATGQNGLFETFSIRGSGANNILVLFGGMPLTAQRRAGIPVSFVEPLLLGDVAVTRGPAVVHYGPGALGGAISIEPRWFEAPEFTAGYATGGDERVLAAGLGSEDFSFGAAHHQAGDTRAADGTPLRTRFDRISAVAQYRARIGDFDLDALLAPSRSTDIGKSSIRYPARDTVYPEDEHHVARVRLRHANGFQASVHAHDQYLGTYNTRPGQPDTFAGVESLDLGATVQQAFATGALSHDLGVEYLGRRNVDAYDATRNLLERRYTLREGEEDGWSLFAITDFRPSEALAFEFGARHSRIEQAQRGARADDSATSFTTGAVWRPAEGHRLSANLATGHRFATLEERYFSGVTAQGEIVGNAELSSEHSRGVDVGHVWSAGRWRTEVHLWRTEVDDLIQLTRVAPGINGYTNVGEARLQGVDAEVAFTPIESLALRAGLTYVDSEDRGTGDPLYGSPPLTTELEARWQFGDFTLGGRWHHRFELDEPGFEETERDAVDVIDAELGWRPSTDWHVKLYVQNLFDENYFATADVLSARAPERSIGLQATFTLR